MPALVAFLLFCRQLCPGLHLGTNFLGAAGAPVEVDVLRGASSGRVITEHLLLIHGEIGGRPFSRREPLRARLLALARQDCGVRHLGADPAQLVLERAVSAEVWRNGENMLLWNDELPLLVILVLLWPSRNRLASESQGVSRLH